MKIELRKIKKSFHNDFLIFPFMTTVSKNAIINISGNLKESGRVFGGGFWYTDSSQKYIFPMEEYTDDSSYEPGEIIRIFLDEEGKIILIAHEVVAKNIIGIVILTFGIPVLVLLLHATDHPVLMLAVAAYTIPLYILITGNERIQTEIKQEYEMEKDLL